MKEQALNTKNISKEENTNSHSLRGKQQTIIYGQTLYTPISKRVEQKVQKIFRDFYFQSITFSLVFINCLMWLSVNIVHYANNYEWDCVQYIFFAKYQPSISYNYQFWRLIMSSLMFRSWTQFYFNTFALNMLGYVIQKKSRTQFLVFFYGGILAGHMLSCCFADPNLLTVGTSCGTIALLPVQILRYFKLRKTNPIQAISRRRFLIFNLLMNFLLNILAVFHLNTVDWISHIGCIIAGILFMIYYEAKNMKKANQMKIPRVESSVLLKIKIVQIGSVIILVAFYVIMALAIWVYLPSKNIGKQQMQEMNFLCNKNNIKLI